MGRVKAFLYEVAVVLGREDDMHILDIAKIGEKTLESVDAMREQGVEFSAVDAKFAEYVHQAARSLGYDDNGRRVENPSRVRSTSSGRGCSRSEEVRRTRNQESTGGCVLREKG